MVKFGPSGNSDSFYEVYKSTDKAPLWLKNKGLNAYEYAFSRGIKIKEEAAKMLGDEFKKYDIALSVHAPYYINFASTDEVQVEKSYEYIISSIKMMRNLGSDRLIFHPGSLTKQTRSEALAKVLQHLKELVRRIKAEKLSGFYLCPETMGKHGQVGTVEEVCEMCKIDSLFMPALDFGHINAYTRGAIKTENEYRKVFEYLIKELGEERGRKVHIHFSKIQYGDKGELKHLNFDEDNVFGPPFEPLAKVLKEMNINARIICESRGKQVEDATKMKEIFEKQ